MELATVVVAFLALQAKEKKSLQWHLCVVLSIFSKNNQIGAGGCWCLEAVVSRYSFALQKTCWSCVSIQINILCVWVGGKNNNQCVHHVKAMELVSDTKNRTHGVKPYWRMQTSMASKGKTALKLYTGWFAVVAASSGRFEQTIKQICG